MAQSAKRQKCCKQFLLNAYATALHAAAVAAPAAADSSHFVKAADAQKMAPRVGPGAA